MSSEILKSESVDNGGDTYTSLPDHNELMSIFAQNQEVVALAKAQKTIANQTCKVAGLLGYEKGVTLEQIILEKMSVENFVAHFEKKKTDPVKAWNIFHFITQNLRHVAFHPNVSDRILSSHKKNDSLITYMLIDTLKNGQLHHIDNLNSLNESKHYCLILHKQPGLPCSSHHDIPWSEHAPNPTHEKIKKSVVNYLDEVKHISNVLCENCPNPTLGLKQALQETGVISISWPISWGANQEIENNIANLLTGLNHQLCSITGLSGPLLGISGKLCIHLGMETDTVGGLMYIRKGSTPKEGWYDLILAGRFIDKDYLIRTFFHEWFHAFDAELGQKIGYPYGVSFLSTLPKGSMEKIGLHGNEEILMGIQALQNHFLPKLRLNPSYSKQVCDDFIAIALLMLEKNKKGTFLYDITPFLKEILIENSYQKTNILNGRILHINEIYDQADSSFFYAFAIWAQTKHLEISAILSKRERSTRFHPNTILFRLFKSSALYVKVRDFNLFSLEELFARAFEQMICNKIGLNESFEMILDPVIPGYDTNMSYVLWHNLFKSLAPWWENNTTIPQYHLTNEEDSK